MKKFLNEVKHIETELLEGLAFAHGDLLALEQGNLVVNKKLEAANRVTIVALGLTGNEPALSGYVGQGMVDIVVAGPVFTAPGPATCVEALKLADRGQGSILIVPNHTGFTLTGSLAIKEAARLGLKAAQVVVGDDAAEGRGLLGLVPLCKILGAAAAGGCSLEELVALAGKVNSGMATLAVAASGATHPVTGQQLASVEAGMVAYGAGLHGETAAKLLPLESANSVAQLVMDALLEKLQPKPGAQVLLLVSGSGSTSLMEQLIVFRSCYGYLLEQGLQVVASKVGELLTVQETAGLQLSLVLMDQQLLTYWQASCNTPYFKN